MVCGCTVANFYCSEASATVVVRLRIFPPWVLTGGLRIQDRVLNFLIPCKGHSQAPVKKLI